LIFDILLEDDTSGSSDIGRLNASCDVDRISMLVDDEARGVTYLRCDLMDLTGRSATAGSKKKDCREQE
jgi:hypothetical protein